MSDLKRLVGWVVRLYLFALLAGTAVLGAAWYTGDLADVSEAVGALWYGIAGLGTLTLLLLVATLKRTQDPGDTSA